MSSLVCAFGKRIRRFRSNYLDLLFERQNIEVDIFTGLLNLATTALSWDRVIALTLVQVSSQNFLLISSKYPENDYL